MKGVRTLRICLGFRYVFITCFHLLEDGFGVIKFHVLSVCLGCFLSHLQALSHPWPLQPLVHLTSSAYFNLQGYIHRPPPSPQYLHRPAQHPRPDSLHLALQLRPSCLSSFSPVGQDCYHVSPLRLRSPDRILRQ